MKDSIAHQRPPGRRRMPDYTPRFPPWNHTSRRIAGLVCVANRRLLPGTQVRGREFGCDGSWGRPCRRPIIRAFWRANLVDFAGTAGWLNGTAVQDRCTALSSPGRHEPPHTGNNCDPASLFLDRRRLRACPDFFVSRSHGTFAHWRTSNAVSTPTSVRTQVSIWIHDPCGARLVGRRRL